jgi:hypothetical protein
MKETRIITRARLWGAGRGGAKGRCVVDPSFCCLQLRVILSGERTLLLSGGTLAVLLSWHAEELSTCTPL